MEHRWHTTQEVADYWGVANQVVSTYTFLYERRSIIKGLARSFEYKPKHGSRQITKKHTKEDILYILLYNNFGITKEMFESHSRLVPILECKVIAAYIMFYHLKYSKTEIALKLHAGSIATVYVWLKNFDLRYNGKIQFKVKHNLIINEFSKYDLENKRWSNN